MEAHGPTTGLDGLVNAWLSPSGEIVVDADDFEAQAWHEQVKPFIKWITKPTLTSAQRAVIEAWCVANSKTWDDVVDVVY